MAKRTYQCSNCKHVLTKWASSCPNCGEIGTIDEAENVTALAPSTTKPGTRADRATSGDKPELIADIKAAEYVRLSSGVGEVDRVLGGGFVPGGIVLLAGAPGVGKSSILSLIASNMSRNGQKVLYVSGEETKNQIKSRLDRIKADTSNFYLMSESNLNNVKNSITTMQPDVLIIDSIQTLISDTSEGRVGSVSQVTEVAQEITHIGKRLNIPTILVGHVTKDGNIAGPRVVEHLVDTVMYFESSNDSPLRLLRVIKSRFSSVDEIGTFEHQEDGLHEIADPSGFFINTHDDSVSGYSTSVILEGLRALPIEVQALVTPSPLPNPRKITYGIEHSRSLMIQAMLEKYAGVRLDNKDVYVSMTNGLAIKDGSLDLAIAASIISSYLDVPPAEHSVYIGELSLTGEVRRVRSYEKRVNEAKRLGFIEVIDDKRVKTIRDLYLLMSEKMQ